MPTYDRFTTWQNAFGSGETHIIKFSVAHQRYVKLCYFQSGPINAHSGRLHESNGEPGEVTCKRCLSELERRKVPCIQHS